MAFLTYSWIVLIYFVVFVRTDDKTGLFELKYSIKRNQIQQEERAFSGYQQVYTKDEQIVKNYLDFLKWEEFNNTRNNFPPARPVKLNIDSVKRSNIYQILKRFPKGGNMHLHHNHVVSKSKILDLVFSDPLYDNLYVKLDEPKRWRLDFFLNPPQGWAKVKGNSTFTKSLLVQHATLLGVMDDKAINDPTNSGLRWFQMGPLFSVIGSHVINQANISEIYMKAMLQAAMDENVQYLETKTAVYNKLYVLDANQTFAPRHGKRYIDNEDGELEIKMVNNIVQQFGKDNPSFIGYKRIINSYRWKSTSSVGLDAERALRLYKKYPNLISGFDMVSEEDKGYSLLFYLEDFAKLAAQNSSLPYFFHTAETNWPGDLLTSIHADDPVATMENIYDAIILGAKRVGHGIGYLDHPYLMEILKKRKIAIEANPVSNQMLGYVPDQRHHPAITYLRYGIPVVLGADDPATLGYNEFTLDWYEAFMAWGLNLGDLRHLAMNSLQYSSLSASEKTTAMAKWKIAWDIFITETKSKACMHTFQNLTPIVFRIFPKEGHINGDTKIRVFGRNFQVAVCKTIICRFGSELTYGTFVYEHMLICNSPKRTPQTLQTPINPLHVPFSVSLDNGATFQGTGIVFSYLHANISHHFTGTDIFGK